MKRCLLIIDVQNEYFKGGKMELKNTEETVDNIKEILFKFRKTKEEIIYIKHISLDKSKNYFIENTNGVEIYNKIKPEKNEKIIIKNYPNSFFKTELEKHLEEKEIKELIICGMMSHMCIDSTTRAAYDKGYKCTVINDCCTTKDLKFNEKIIKFNDVHASFMAALSNFAEIRNSDEI